MIFDVVAVGMISILTIAWLAHDNQRQKKNQRALIFAAVGSLGATLEYLPPFGDSSSILPTSLLLIYSAIAYIISLYYAVISFQKESDPRSKV